MLSTWNSHRHAINNKEDSDSVNVGAPVKYSVVHPYDESLAFIKNHVLEKYLRISGNSH